MVITSMKNSNPKGNVMLLLGRDSEGFPLEITRHREIWPGKKASSSNVLKEHLPVADGRYHRYVLVRYQEEGCRYLQMWRFEYRGDWEIKFVDAGEDDLGNAIKIFQTYLRPSGKTWVKPDSDEEDFLRLTYGLTGLDKGYYKEKASFRDTGAMRELAAMHLDDYEASGSERSVRKCLKWYKKAADLGDVDAMRKISNLYRDGKGVSQNDNEAWRWILKSYEAAPDNTETIFCIAFMYAHGCCVERNSEKAREWYEKAAMLGSTRAMHKLGALYKTGRWRVGGGPWRGIQSDRVKAEEWTLKAVELGGHAKSIDMLLSLRDMEKDYEKKYDLYKKAAEAGSAESMFALASMYKKGEGIAQDYGQAAFWYRKAAQLGYPDATKALGIMYDQGLGVQQSY